jgi:uncharacterized protein with HEPN domain
MRHDSLYLTDIVEAADHIAAFIAETDFPAFQKSELLRSAVVQKLAIVGEAAARVSEELKTRHPQVPWPQIIAFRNILVHAYLSTRTSESTGMWCGGPPGIVARFCGSRLPASSQRNPAAPKIRVAGPEKGYAPHSPYFPPPM